jgi:hypothetical protein
MGLGIISAPGAPVPSVSLSATRAGGQCGAGGECWALSRQIAKATGGALTVIGSPNSPERALVPELPIAHYAVSNLDGTITDVTLLGNALSYNKAGTILPTASAIKNIADPAARAAAASIGNRDTFSKFEYKSLLHALFPSK